MKNTIHILLVNSINPIIEVESRYPHLGLGYLVSYARKFYSDSDVIFKIIDRDIEKTVGEFNPDFVGITSVTQNFDIAKNYITYFDSLNIPVILGGVHITSLPETLPINTTAACIGEGEITFVEFIKSFDD